MKTLKKSLSLLLVALTLFAALGVSVSAVEYEGVWLSAWDIDSHGVIIVCGSDCFDEIAPGKEVEIYYSEEPYWYKSEFLAAVEDGTAELVGTVGSSNLEIIPYDFYGMTYDALYIKPLFDFKKGGYYHFVVEEGTLVSSDGTYASYEEVYISAPISSTTFNNSNFFQKIADFFRSIIEWIKNLFA